ncbi:MAG: hypothetical protein KGJ60_15050 [Verrucomicrobiota bacterium]|nr:hypothetical protein [Verrucomicrobiota bacterium]
MDRWAALSMLETGDNDSATGAVGEISRFQIRPQLWPGGNPEDSKTALAAAQKIMGTRVAAFERTHRHPPTDFEFYVLWNAPGEVDHPCARVAARARRFANLVQRSASGLQTMARRTPVSGVRLGPGRT